MTRTVPQPRARRTASRTAVIGVLAAAMVTSLAGTAQAATAVGLGTASSFAVLAGAGITNTGPTTISGDLGTHPTITVNGASTITFARGFNHGADAVSQGAKTDLVTAYDNAALQVSDQTISGDLTGRTLTPGVYTSASSLLLTGELILDGAGDANAVFIFQAGSSLTTMTGSRVTLVNGANACNVFWQVGSSATLGTASTFVGNIIAFTSITATTGATVDGRLLARNGAVTLDTNVVTSPAGCTTVSAPPVVEPTPTPTATPTPTPTPQVTAVPVGPVATGDGTTVPNGLLPGAPALLVGLLLVAGTGALAVRRHRTR